MKEIISVTIGQGGIQIGNAVWELFCSEHGIDSDGKHQIGSNAPFTNARTFFCPVSDTQFVPRALAVDLENTVVDEIRTGSYRKLFHPEMLLSGYEDSSNNFARGHFTIGRKMIGRAMNQIRRIVHTCDMLQGFFIISAVGGGTGSGFETLLLESLSVEYSKYCRVAMSIFPSSHMATSTVEPYNALLHSNFTLETIDISMNFDNESSYKLCKNQLDIDNPSYNNINRIIAYLTSNLTVSMRYESMLNSDFNQMVTNLVPFPRIHFPILNCSPLISNFRASHDTFSINDITRKLFSPSNQLISVDPTLGNYYSCAINYRGNATPRLANDAIFEIKRQNIISFVDWCPTGFKVGINHQPPVAMPASLIATADTSVSMLANTSSFIQVWLKENKKFDWLFSKKAFVHWYVGEGMEEAEFTESRNTMEMLILDHSDIDNEEAEAETLEQALKEERNKDLEHDMVEHDINNYPSDSVGEEFDEAEVEEPSRKDVHFQDELDNKKHMSVKEQNVQENYDMPPGMTNIQVLSDKSSSQFEGATASKKSENKSDITDTKKSDLTDTKKSELTDTKRSETLKTTNKTTEKSTDQSTPDKLTEKSDTKGLLSGSDKKSTQYKKPNLDEYLSDDNSYVSSDK